MQRPGVERVSTFGRNCSIRLMAERDISGVEEIYREAFPTSLPLPPFVNELRSSDTAFLVAYQGNGNQFSESLTSPKRRLSIKSLMPAPRMLTSIKTAFSRALKNDRLVRSSILGFVAISLIDESAHITSIASHIRFRGMGIGELLLIGAVEVALFKRLSYVTLEVRVSNEIAQSLYRKYGFKEIGIRRRYYLDNGEDALIMTTDLITTPFHKCSFSNLIKRHELRWGISVRKLESP